MSDLAIIVTGVSGSGKTTIGRLLAERLGWLFADADDFHPDSNVEKLTRQQPLTDADREPWLAALCHWLDEQHERERDVVLACSALKRRYRDRLRKDRPHTRFVYLHGARDVIARRLTHREGHFMRAHMLEGQISDLEPPQADEGVITVDVDATPDQIVDEILSKLESASQA
ncbi:MAG TPA: gluconokinase [Candidatus Stackebrandtia excrementipullorum]|nr:gluconokinase [Candidatus Stackebrandtia excrementipullorum]